MARKEKTGGFFMEIEGRERVVLAGCRGIDAYAEDAVCLRTPFGKVTVYGHTLELGCMTVDGATVSGCITRIELQ
jgi:sporulation protein YqfC